MKKIYQHIRKIGVCSIFSLAIACQDPKLKKEESVDTSIGIVPINSIEFPISKTLHDSQGRPLNASIIGRSVSELTVIRTDDNRRFQLPISNLSKEDQKFAANLPIYVAPASPKPNERSQYIENREKELERMRAEVEELESKIKLGNPKSPRVRGYEREMDKIKGEIERLQSQIDNYQG